MKSRVIIKMGVITQRTGDGGFCHTAWLHVHTYLKSTAVDCFASRPFCFFLFSLHTSDSCGAATSRRQKEEKKQEGQREV